MNFYGRALTLGACAAFLAGGTVGIAQRRNEPAGPYAFLDFQVESTDELVAVLESNATLRKRFAKHFGVSEAEVVNFVKRALVPHRLTENRAVVNYGVNKTGRIFGKRTVLRKGTRVWANRSGVPILKWLCANPLTNKLPIPAGQPSLSGRPQPVAVRPVRSLPPELGTAPIPVMPPTNIVSIPPTPTTVATGPIPGGGTGVIPFVPAVTTGGGLGFLPALLLPLAFSGGGGGSTTPVQVIPEPGTVTLLAMGGLPVAFAAVRRARRRRGSQDAKTNTDHAQG